MVLLLLMSSVAVAGDPGGQDDGRLDRAYRSMFDNPDWFLQPSSSTVAGPGGLYAQWWEPDGGATGGEGDLYAGIARDVWGGLSLDTGVASHRADPQLAGNYKEYYFGLAYENVEGRVWYTDDYEGQGLAKSYYEFGLRSDLNEDFSLSARLGYGDMEPGRGREKYTDYSLAAELRDVHGFGVGLRVMGTRDQAVAGQDDVRLLGTISRSFK